MKKLKIKELQVKSFVVDVDAAKSETLKGGILSIGRHCTHCDNGCYSSDQSKALFCNPH